MVTAVIFDCFGVLTSDAWTPFKAAHFASNTELFEEAESLSKQSDAGLISYADFIEGVAALAGMTYGEVRQDIERNVANEPLLAYIKQLKPTYKIGLLSNASANVLEMLFTAEQLQLFDVVAISYETGFVKPGERAFTDIADKLAVPTEECLLVDDVQRNCTAAKETGMQTILYQNLDQTLTDLNQILK
ncbi:MAG: HAD-IA family hydrolase [Patescibacteria group bacterium]|nr:HAD-IA family hydrolase [Patescibacteria group bacterium]